MKCIDVWIVSNKENKVNYTETGHFVTKTLRKRSDRVTSASHEIDLARERYKLFEFQDII